MFASKTVVEHLARGVVGVGAFALATAIASSPPWLALVLLPVGFVALRGCPMCWTVGLVQTVAAKLQGKSAAGLCADGGCSLSDRSRPPVGIP
jgi:hypothetical protein